MEKVNGYQADDKKNNNENQEPVDERYKNLDPRVSLNFRTCIDG
jgi:hypothetical protein